MQTPEHIHTPVGHACRASRGIFSSETLWFCLEPRSIQLPSTTSRRFPYLGHIGITVWEAIIGEEGLRKQLANDEYDKHTHTVRINTVLSVDKTLTMSMLEENYPSESWVRVYTDGSATNATTKGGAGIYIQYPNGEQQSEAIPTGLHCSNYKAEGEAIIHAAHTIKCKVDNNTQVVFLTDALSVLQALMNDNLPQLEQALYTIKTIRTVLQWIPSHCGVHGNE